MKVRHLILMLLEASGGLIESKTKLQKEIYFISLKMKENIKFQAYYYGPYSFEVEEGLDELIGAGFVDVRRTVYGIKSDTGFEHKRYSFSITESGKKLIDSLVIENSDKYKEIECFTDTLKKIGNPDYINLSLAAKAHFILTRENQGLTREQIMEKAKNFGWNVSENDIKTAANMLQGLGFVKTN